jgi:hypothetical protein
MRVRVAIEKHSTADEHQRKILAMYRKFAAQQTKQFNDISEEKGEDDEIEDSDEDDLTDLEILGITSSDHPCIDEIFVEKQACGMRNRPCEYEVFGIPRK